VLPSSKEVGAAYPRKEGKGTMKRLGIITALALCLMVIMSGVALAADPPDEGLDVDIVIVGDEPDVDIDIVGDDSTVYVDGWDISTPNIVSVRNSSSSDNWARTKIKEVILPDIENIYYITSLTANGLAKLILVNGAQVESFKNDFAELNTGLVELEEYSARLAMQAQLLRNQDARLSQRLDAQQAVLEGLQTQVEANHIATMNYLEYRIELLKYNYSLVLWGLLGLIIVLALAFSISFVALRHRIKRI